METKKKAKNSTAQSPVKTIRSEEHRAIAASIWLRTTQTGFAYYEYSLSRAWKSQNSGKEGHSTNFFPRNASAMVEVIEKASAWIEANNPDETSSEAA